MADAAAERERELERERENLQIQMAMLQEQQDAARKAEEQKLSTLSNLRGPTQQVYKQLAASSNGVAATEPLAVLLSPRYTTVRSRVRNAPVRPSPPLIRAAFVDRGCVRPECGCLRGCDCVAALAAITTG